MILRTAIKTTVIGLGAASALSFAAAPAQASAGPGAVPDFGSGDSAWTNYYAHPSDMSTWSAFCGGGGGHVAAEGDGFPACGPTGGTSIEVPGGISTPGFQCVELSERALYVEHGWTAEQANGAQVAKSYASAHGVALIKNGTSGVAPHVGDIMSFSDYSSFSDTGHTAVVTASSVNSSGNGSITILSQNWNDTGSLNSFTVKAWWVAEVSGYPYSEWIQSGSGSSASLTNGSFVQVSGQPTVYEIVGGAPVFVHDWADVGGSHAVTSMTQSQFNSLPAYPANGTAVYDDTPGPTHGTGYVFAGGAPLAVAGWANVGSPHYIPVDGYSLDHYAATGQLSHVLEYPQNGTAVYVDNPGSGHGAGYIFAGGAPMAVANWANVGKPKLTGVDSFALTHYATTGALSHVQRYPVNGTPVFVDNPGSGHGSGFVYAGGAPLAVANWSNLGAPKITPIDRFALNPGTSTGTSRAVPANGTAVAIGNPGAGHGAGYIFAGGAPLAVTSWSAVGSPAYTIVDSVALGARSPSVGFPTAHPANGTFVEGAQTHEVFEVTGGVAMYLSSWSKVGGVKPYTVIDQLALDRAGIGGAYDHLVSSTPSARITAPTSKTTRSRSVKVAWASPPEASTVSSSDVRLSTVAAGSHVRWRRPSHLQGVGTAMRSTTITLARGHELCVAVRAHDQAGKTGGWSPAHCITRR